MYKFWEIYSAIDNGVSGISGKSVLDIFVSLASSMAKNSRSDIDLRISM